jgi:hypothetical protein
MLESKLFAIRQCNTFKYFKFERSNEIEEKSFKSVYRG